MLTLFFRTIIIYFTLVLSLRLMGKRQIGELEISEFINAIILSEIAAVPLTNRNAPLLYSLIPILLLLSVEIFLSYFTVKVPKVKRIFYGSPTVLILRGRIQQAELLKNRIELDELLAELRLQGYPDVSEIRYAILEENGKLSVFPNADASPATPAILSLSVPETGIPHRIILDGEVQNDQMRIAGWDKKRLAYELQKNHVSANEVFLLTVDDANSVTLIRKEDKS